MMGTRGNKEQELALIFNPNSPLVVKAKKKVSKILDPKTEAVRAMKQYSGQGSPAVDAR